MDNSKNQGKGYGDQYQDAQKKSSPSDVKPGQGQPGRDHQDTRKMQGSTDSKWQQKDMDNKSS